MLRVRPLESLLFAAATAVAACATPPAAPEVGETSSAVSVMGGPHLLWQNPSTGQVAAWLLAGTSVTNVQPLSWGCGASDGCSSTWQPVDTIDDNTLLWFNPTNGQLQTWAFDRSGNVTGSLLNATCDDNGCSQVWRPVGRVTLGGVRGLLWHNAQSGQLGVWDLSGNDVTNVQWLSWQCGPACALDWKAVLTADLDDDGNSDILWQNTSTRTLGVWLLDGQGNVTGTYDSIAGPVWCPDGCRPVGTADFDADGHTDILWYEPNSGALTVILMDGHGHSTGSEQLGWTSQGTDWRPLGLVSFPYSQPAGSGLSLSAIVNGLCLDIPGYSVAAGTRAQPGSCNGASNAQWKIVPVGVGYNLVSVNSGLCLDVTGASWAPGTPIEQWPCTGHRNQVWNFHPLAGLPAWFEISSLDSGLCLDASGPVIQQVPCVPTLNGGISQVWSLSGALPAQCGGAGEPVCASGCAGALTRGFPGATCSVAPQLAGGAETSVAVAPAFTSGSSSFPASVIVAYNDKSQASHTQMELGWATSQDGKTFTRCNGSVAPCTVPMAPRQADWRGDPAIAAAPQGGGIVVYENMALDTSQNPDDAAHMVVAALSFDGGRSFGTTVQVNDNGCANGNVDQGAIAFDSTSSTPDIWFVFRHDGVGKSGGTYGICVRGGTVNPTTRTIDWFGPPQEMQNLERAQWQGVGGTLIQPANGVVTVMYSNTDHEFDHCSGGKEINWLTGTSSDRGATWSGSHSIYDTHDFNWCTSGGHYMNSIRAFGFTRDAQNRLWAAVQDSPSTIRVFSSANEGWSWSASTTITVAGFPSLYLPTLAADDAGRVALAFYGSDAGGTKMGMFTAIHDANQPPQTRGAPQPLGTTFKPVGTSSRDLGDYNGMTVLPAGTFDVTAPESFVPAWAAEPFSVGVGFVAIP